MFFSTFSSNRSSLQILDNCVNKLSKTILEQSLIPSKYISFLSGFIFLAFANEDFCKVAGYKLDELIGKNHNIVRHSDMPKAAFGDLWKTIEHGDVWSGYVKNKTRDGDFYWVYATVYPMKGENGKKKYMSCRRKPSKQEIHEAQELYKTLR